MPATTYDLGQKVAETANRVRLVQISMADEKEDVRKKDISYEIEQALLEVIPAQRKAFLQQLMDRFPVMGGGGEAAPQAAAGPVEGVDPANLKDPYFLAGKLVEVAASLSESEKRDLAEELEAAGLTGRGAAAWPGDAERELRQQLKMKDGETVSPDRALALLGSLAELAASVDQVAGTTWHELARKAGAAPRSQLKDRLGHFLAGQTDVSPDQVKKDVEKARQLTAALLAAVGRVAGQFAKTHVKRLSPSAIQDWVKMERGGFLQSEEVRCWKKYVEVAGDLTEASVEREIMDLMANSAEELMGS
jgi:hypothetical protein